MIRYKYYLIYYIVSFGQLQGVPQKNQQVSTNKNTRRREEWGEVTKMRSQEEISGKIEKNTCI
jgi:hypothetical protein